MPDIVKILYNSVDAFGPQATPLVALDEETIYASERWGVRENMTLQGQLTGCTFGDVYSGQLNLLSHFNKSYQSLEIWQQQGLTSGRVFQKDLVEVQSISFPESQWWGVLPYTIQLSCYPSGLFSGAFGVLEPSDGWSFQEQDNEILAATHTISCKAFNTSNGVNNALTNARGWAFGRTGTASMPAPILISGVNGNYFCLQSLNENINRFNGTYSLTENWTNDLARTGYGSVRYSTVIDSGSNLITVRLNGTAQGCNGNISGTRDAFGVLDKVAIVTKAYQYAFNKTDLNPIPLTQTFNEEAQSARIEFDYVFNNDNSPEISFDYAVNCSVGTNGAITAAIQGLIRVRGDTLPNKLIRAQAYANTVDLYALTLPFYNAFDASSIAPLNPVPISDGRSVNQSDGTVQLNATYTNQTKVSSLLDRFDYTLIFGKAIKKVDSKPTVNGLGVYSVVDLGYANRAALSINGSAVINAAVSSSDGVNAIKQAAQNLLAQYGLYGNITLDRNTVTVSRYDDRIAAFEFSWSFDGSNVVGPTSINTLTI